ncbi:MAG: hypothetical protein AABY22_29310, partial [Nanoarchaeota archaeon]
MNKKGEGIKIIGLIFVVALLIFFVGNYTGYFSLISPLQEQKIGGVGCNAGGLIGSSDLASPDGPNKLLDYSIQCSSTINQPLAQCLYQLKGFGAIVSSQVTQPCAYYFSDLNAKIKDSSKTTVYQDNFVELLYTGNTESVSTWFLKVKEDVFVPNVIFTKYIAGLSTPQKIQYKIQSKYPNDVESVIVGRLTKMGGLFGLIEDNIEYEERQVTITNGDNLFSFDIPSKVTSGNYIFSVQTYIDSDVEYATCLLNGQPSCFTKSNSTAITNFIKKEFVVETSQIINPISEPSPPLSIEN